MESRRSHFELLQRVIADVPTGFVVWALAEDGSLVCRAISEALAEIDGVSVDGHLGRTPIQIVPQFAYQIEPVIRGVFETRSVCTLDVVDSTEGSIEPARTFTATYYPVFSADHADVQCVAGHVLETTQLLSARTAEDRSRRRLELLAASGAVLAPTRDVRDALTSLTSLLVPTFADMCWLRLSPDFDPSRAIEPFVIRHADPDLQAPVERIVQGLRLAPNLAYGAPAALRTGRPQLAVDMESEFTTGGWEREHRDLFRRLEIHSAIFVPITSAVRVLGTMTLCRSTTTAPYDEADLADAMEIGRRAGLVLEYAELHGRLEQQAATADALEHASDGVLLVDDGERLRYCNEASESMLGISRGSVIGTRLECVEAWPRIVEAARIVAPGEPVPATATPIAVTVAEDERWLSAVGVPVASIGTVYTLRDVTDSRRLEQITSEFVATVSHELRTPLTVLRGAAATLLREDIELETGVRRQLLRDIEGQSERLARIVGEILTARELDYGTVTMHVAELDVPKLVADVIDDLASIAPHNVNVRSELPDARLVAIGDHDRVVQVLTNLVENAFRYSPQGGTVTVRVRRGSGTVQLEVEDEGVGIPFQDRERVFDKFVRLDAMHRQGTRGSGLGLYVSRELVRRMGGRIWVHSRPGTGSTFHVELAAASDHEATGPISASSITIESSPRHGGPG